MKREKVTVYFNKTFFISGMIWSLCCISPWIVFLYLQTGGFREVILDEGFFVLAVFFAACNLLTDNSFIYRL